MLCSSVKFCSFSAALLVLLPLTLVSTGLLTDGCRVGSEKLKAHVRQSIEYLLDAEQLQAIYWPAGEPLDVRSLAKATGIDISLAETRFLLAEPRHSPAANSSGHSLAANVDHQLIKDIFVSCSIDRERNYALSINLELTNPFKVIEVQYSVVKPTEEHQHQQQGEKASPLKRMGSFMIHLPESSFLVNLMQRVRYDECLAINYVQLAPHSSYQIECAHCDQEQRSYLDKMLAKRMQQLESQLDSILSDKLLLGLQVLFNQQRLNLDLLHDQAK